jgi:hypothetical protein
VTGPTGITGYTGPTGPATNVNIAYISNTGYTGLSLAVGATGYFLDSVNLPISVTNVSSKYLINASCQMLYTAGIRNISASILRSNTGMSGTALPDTYINLANNLKTTVTYPPLDTETPTNTQNLNTSLWSYSTLSSGVDLANRSPNGLTINMQAFDTGFTGPGNYYYAIRVQTDASNLYYGNIRMSSINFS